MRFGAETRDRTYLRDDPAARAAVWDWLEASVPAYRLWPPEEEASAVRFTEPRAPWSDEPSLDEAITMATRYARIRIDRVTRDGAVNDVAASVSWGWDARLIDDPVVPVRLRFTCGDPRLLREGTTWLAPVVTRDFDDDEPPFDGYLVPGVLLPDAQWIASAVEERRQRERARP